MSSHESPPKTPPPNPKEYQAHLEAQLSTNPNKGSSASGQILHKVKKDLVEPRIAVDMEKRKHCNPEDMVRFLLALCCQDDSSTVAVPRDDTLDKRFKDCLKEVTPIADLPDLQNRLKSYQSSACDHEKHMYRPFTGALNCALEPLSKIKVDGLPKFKSHIVFTVCDKGVLSSRSLRGSSFKPDIAVMSIEDAQKFYGLGQPQGNESPLFQFMSGATEQSRSGSLCWNSILSVVEVKRKKDWTWGKLDKLDPQVQVSVIPDSDDLLDEKLDDPQPNTPVSWTTLVSSKRSASVAGMDASAGTLGGKRQRTQKNSTNEITLSLATQDGTYAAEKFSDSFSISHVLNLLVKNDCLWISWIDREGAIFSHGFSFFENLALTLVLLLVFQRFGRRQWGYIPELTTMDHLVSLHPVNPDGTLGEDEVDFDFDRDDKVHSSWALLGRATTVVGAKRREGDGNETMKGEHTNNIADTKVEDHRDDVARIPDVQDSKDVPLVPKEGTGVSSGVDGNLGKKWTAFYSGRNKYRRAFSNTIRLHNLVLKVSWPETSRVEEWRIIKYAHSLGKEDKFIEGHIPEVTYARDLGRYSTQHIRNFLGLREDGSPGTRTLRLIVMKRLRPIFDLDGEEFWNAFWQCVACHYNLWVKGIHHGDISLRNLMCDFPTGTGDPMGVLNDFDLATWDKHPTTNNDRTGTIPFMALDLLGGGLDNRIRRLYRHDLESFGWVLAYVTVADIEYNGCTIKISPLGEVEAWFRDDEEKDRKAHIMSKKLFHRAYGRVQEVSGRYSRYSDVIRRIIAYWNRFHESLEECSDYSTRLPQPNPSGNWVEQNPSKPEPVQDNPEASLRSFIANVEESFKGDELEGFPVVKNLLGAIAVDINASYM